MEKVKKYSNIFLWKRWRTKKGLIEQLRKEKIEDYLIKKHIDGWIVLYN